MTMVELSGQRHKILGITCDHPEFHATKNGISSIGVGQFVCEQVKVLNSLVLHCASLLRMISRVVSARTLKKWRLFFYGRNSPER